MLVCLYMIIHIPEGDYYTLTDIALRLHKSKQAIHQRTRKLGLQPLKLGYLEARYNGEQYKAIWRSYQR
jgi:hypothetical protein